MECARMSLILVLLACTTFLASANLHHPSHSDEGQVPGASLETVTALLEQQSARIMELEHRVYNMEAKYEVANGRLQEAISVGNQSKAEHADQIRLEQQDARIRQLESLAMLGWSNGSRTADTPIIAFTVGLADTYTGGGDNSVIPFDVVYLNHGDAYSTSNYHFTAPIRGVYWFSMSIMNNDKGGAKASLAVNGQNMLTAEADANYNGDAQSGIFMLEAMDRVACQKWYHSNELHDYDGHSFNSFAGFLYASLLE